MALEKIVFNAHDWMKALLYRYWFDYAETRSYREHEEDISDRSDNLRGKRDDLLIDTIKDQLRAISPMLVNKSSVRKANGEKELALTLTLLANMEALSSRAAPTAWLSFLKELRTADEAERKAAERIAS